MKRWETIGLKNLKLSNFDRSNRNNATNKQTNQVAFQIALFVIHLADLYQNSFQNQYLESNSRIGLKVFQIVHFFGSWVKLQTFKNYDNVGSAWKCFRKCSTLPRCVWFLSECQTLQRGPCMLYTARKKCLCQKCLIKVRARCFRYFRKKFQGKN